MSAPEISAQRRSVSASVLAIAAAEPVALAEYVRLQAAYWSFTPTEVLSLAVIPEAAGMMIAEASPQEATAWLIAGDLLTARPFKISDDPLPIEQAQPRWNTIAIGLHEAGITSSGAVSPIAQAVMVCVPERVQPIARAILCTALERTETRVEGLIGAELDHPQDVRAYLVDLAEMMLAVSAICELADIGPGGRADMEKTHPRARPRVA